MLIKKKVLFLLICITIISPLLLTGCYDLGSATEDDEEYCETYPEIRLVNGSAGVSYYEMADFYNKAAVNDFASPMDEDDRSEYSYLMIKVNKDLALGTVVVHFDSTEQDTLSVSLFVMDSDDLPTKISTGSGGSYSVDECNEPDPQQALATATCKLEGVADKWKAIVLSSWYDGETVYKRYPVQEGQYVVLRINNNCYDAARRQLDEVEGEWNRAKAEYDQKATEWQTINSDPTATQEERNSAMSALNQALAAKNVAERDYETAWDQYEKNKFPYKKMPVRMTAILINAELEE